MCGPLNRKGLVRNECADGFGPSVTSFGYKCVSCNGTWYGLPLFLVLYFALITMLYLLIIVFQISITSAPMPCFVIYAQTRATIIESDNKKKLPNNIFSSLSCHDTHTSIWRILSHTSCSSGPKHWLGQLKLPFICNSSSDYFLSI